MTAKTGKMDVYDSTKEAPATCDRPGARHHDSGGRDALQVYNPFPFALKGYGSRPVKLGRGLLLCQTST